MGCHRGCHLHISRADDDIPVCWKMFSVFVATTSFQKEVVF